MIEKYRASLLERKTNELNEQETFLGRIRDEVLFACLRSYLIS